LKVHRVFSSWLENNQLAFKYQHLNTNVMSLQLVCVYVNLHVSLSTHTVDCLSLTRYPWSLDPDPDSRSSKVRRNEFRTELNPSGRQSGRFVPRLSRKHRR